MDRRNGRWLLSERASSRFLLSSVVVLMTGIFLVVLGESDTPTITREISASPALYLPLAAVLTVNAICALALLVGMPWYLIRFDQSRRLVKLLWLGSFLALGWYSMSIYYFLVYRRQRPSAMNTNS